MWRRFLIKGHLFEFPLVARVMYLFVLIVFTKYSNRERVVVNEWKTYLMILCSNVMHRAPCLRRENPRVRFTNSLRCIAYLPSRTRRCHFNCYLLFINTYLISQMLLDLILQQDTYLFWTNVMYLRLTIILIYLNLVWPTSSLIHAFLICSKV